MVDQNSASLKFTMRLAQATSELYDLAYVQTDSNLSIVQVSPNLSSVLDDADRIVAGLPLMDTFGEFVGAERAIQSILLNKLPCII
jgi:septum formation inhibitor-activating ATPase MinD